MKPTLKRIAYIIACFMLVFIPSCTSNDSAVNPRAVFNCLSQNPAKEYIFYEIAKPENEQEIWAFDLQDNKSILVPSDISEVLWTSSPGSKWLITDSNLLSSLEPNTCKIQSLYEFDSKYKFLTPIWLNQDQLLINAFEDYPTTTDLYFLDLSSNHVKQLSSGQYVQAVSVPGSEWIQADGVDIEVANLHSSATKILNDFDIQVEASPGAIQFLPGKKEFIFIGSRKGKHQYKIWKSSLQNTQPEVIFEPDIDSSLVYHQMSPNGKYLGLIEQTPDGYSLSFLNLKTNQVDSLWPYPFTITNPEFRWSPDSRSIAIPYEGEMYEPSILFFKGIQVMDIKTGKLEILTEVKFDWLIGWYAGK